MYGQFVVCKLIIKPYTNKLRDSAKSKNERNVAQIILMMKCVNQRTSGIGE